MESHLLESIYDEHNNKCPNQDFGESFSPANNEFNNSSSTIRKGSDNEILISSNIFTSIESEYKNTQYSPLEIFYKIFDDDILGRICEYSNNYMKSCSNYSHREFTLLEIKEFIIINIYFSLFILPEKKHYWKSKFLKTPLQKIMTYSRFITLSKFFHIAEDSHLKLNEKGSDKYLLVKEFLENINKRLINIKRFNSFLTIDECMCSFTGRSSFKQYLKLKKRKWGIKFFNIADSFTGYTYHLIPYTGKTFEYSKKIGIGPSVIEKFLRLNLPVDTHLTFDSFYTRKNYLFKLVKKKIDFTATFSSKVRDFKDYRNVRLLKGNYLSKNEKGVTFLAFQDK